MNFGEHESKSAIEVRQRSDKLTDKALPPSALQTPHYLAGTSKTIHEKPKSLYVSHISIAMFSDDMKEERKRRLMRE
jgi:hypothetical protein